MTDQAKKTHLMPVDPELLLEHSESMAYSIATYAAAQNDSETLLAFLDAGLDAGLTSHTVKRRGGGQEKIVMNPWVKAVENDAVDCVRIMMEHPSFKAGRMMGLRPDGESVLGVALRNGCEKTLALWRASSVKPKVNDTLNSDFAGGHALGVAAQCGDEASVRWLLKLKADPRLNRPDTRGATFEHFLAWGDCAGVLEERLAANPDCADVCQHSYSPSGLEIYKDRKLREGQCLGGSEAIDLDFEKTKGRVYANYWNAMVYAGHAIVQSRAFPQVPSSYVAAITPMTPIACALLNESSKALEIFVRHFGRAVVDEQAKKTLRFLVGARKSVQVSVQVAVTAEAEQREAQLDRAIGVCERWVLGATLKPLHSTPSPESDPATPPRRRTVRL